MPGEKETIIDQVMGHFFCRLRKDARIEEEVIRQLERLAKQGKLGDSRALQAALLREGEPSP